MLCKLNAFVLRITELVFSQEQHHVLDTLLEELQTVAKNPNEQKAKSASPERPLVNGGAGNCALINSPEWVHGVLFQIRTQSNATRSRHRQR